MAVWSQSVYVVVPLVVVILGHWSLLLHGMCSVFSLFEWYSPLICSRSLLGILLTAAWIPGQGCAITNTSNTILAATFIYSMCFDFLVLVLTAIKLGITGKSARKDRSKIVRLIFDDGLIFFMVA